MRIAYVCADPGVPVFGRKGSSVHVQSIMRALLRYGMQVDLFATRVDGPSPPGCEAASVQALPRLPQGDLAQREQAALAANDALRAALAAAGPFDLVYERYALWSFAGMEYARSTGAPGLLEVNAPLIEEQAAHRGLVDHASAMEVAERAFGAATALVAVSQGVAAYLEGQPAARGRVHVVPNGVDPERFPAGIVPTLPGEPGVMRIGFIGTLKPWHGLDTLVEAFAALHQGDPGVRLLVVGDGPERGRLMADVAARGLAEAVHFTGAIDPAQVPGLLASMDVAVAPYPALDDFYFSPLKVYEYMAAGVPVVASRIGQIADVIRDGANGLLCPPGDVAALAAALERLRAEPPLRARLGRAGRATVIQDHTWEAVAGQILELAGLLTGCGRL